MHAGRLAAAFLIGACLMGGWMASMASAQPSPVAKAGPPPHGAATQFFETRVRPVLANRCYACHSSKSRPLQGGLALDSLAALQRGGTAGAVVVPGKPDESRLIQAVRFADPHLRMPPAGKLPPAELEALSEWVKQGAYFPTTEKAGSGSGAVKPRALSPEEGKRFWSFRPFVPGPAISVRRKGWVRTRIDSFLLARLEKEQLQPAAEADRRTLIRRLSFDLIGLPPTPEEITEFEADRRPDAYQRLVERLLASPQHGERWGRHWLDLVRYCDVPEQWAQTEAQAWRYRDWVISAVNADLPYDRFVKLQLAADLLGAGQEDLPALGFLGLSPSYWKELKLAPEVIRTVVAEEWEERIATLSGAILGLTAACARCHDHKSDPITQRDYYALAGVFAGTRLTSRPLLPEERARAVLGARDEVARLTAEAAKLQDRAVREPMAAAELRARATELTKKSEAVKSALPDYGAPLIYAADDAYLDVLPDGPDRTRLEYRTGMTPNLAMQLRGNPAQAGPVVPRRYLEVLSPGAPTPFGPGSGRRDLADAIFRDSTPLVARVVVNRVWRHHFGKGLVETPSNFGVTGDRPSHPELLDDLARRFVEAGWSLKWLHREIVLSSAYRQSGKGHPATVARDPENRLLGRMALRKLEVEAWRDSLLAAAGTLDRAVGGAPMELSDAKNRRRTVYGLVRRRDLDPLLRLYDFPDPVGHSPTRFPTTTPLQQLLVLNSQFMGSQARSLSDRLLREIPSDRPNAADRRIELAHQLLFGRAPTALESALALSYLEIDPENPNRWPDLVEVLMARNDLLFVE